jgi:hypothetical protein
MDYEDFDDDVELDSEGGEGEDWDEETLGLEWDESEAQSVVRDLGITSAS